MQNKRNMSPKKVDIPVQDPIVRSGNFEEVALGYTEEMAIEEANRCLNCKHKPCVSGCPVNVKIPNLSCLLQRVNLRRLMRRFLKPIAFRQYVEGSVPRNPSVKLSVSGHKRRICRNWPS